MIIYFLLIGFAALLLGVEFITETYNSELRGAWLTNIEKIVGQTINSPDIFQPLDRLRYKAVLMIGIIMSVVVIVLMMFIKNITEPLQHMIEKSNEISKGDLSQTITIDANNELADLGGVINEMSSNLQEIIHFSLNTCVSGRNLISDATTLLDQSSLIPEELLETRNKLAELDTELTTLKNVVDCFKFYSIDETPHE
ncbi:MAG: HAMP domain-containing protein [Pseudomonadota bacterium]|nr:HAMP domain-containing protein [Pseudomonadota bacterium]